MDNIVRFVSKSEIERERLIREARAIYDSIFPPVAEAGGPTHVARGRETQEPLRLTPSGKSAADNS